MISFVRHLLELFGVVFLSFRLLPRLWCVWLVGVNLACLLFISHIEAQVVLMVTTLAIILQTMIYQRIGFTRILGSTHILWLPMFAWMATRIEFISSEPNLARWLVLLLATNLTSGVADAIDAARYVRGERAPHYRWSNGALTQ